MCSTIMLSNRKIVKLLIFYVCCIYYKWQYQCEAAIIDPNKVGNNTATSKIVKELLSINSHIPVTITGLKKTHYTNKTTSPLSSVLHAKKHNHQNDSLPTTSEKNKTLTSYSPLINKSTKKSAPWRRNHILKSQFSSMKTTADTHLNRSSVIGSIIVFLITLVAAGSIFVMLACFMHKWKENMGTNTEYPKVEYSMLRQGEEEPEDPMGEILVNIGLALPEDICPNNSESESDDSKVTSIEPSLHEEIIQQPTVKIKSTVLLHLDHEDAVRLLSKNEESDEELLQ